MQVGIYSGSFDPVHKGHIQVARAASQSGLVDEVRMIVSPQNPLKDPSRAANAETRFAALVEELAKHDDLGFVKADDFELTLDPPHYTIRTLDMLREAEPQNSFILIIGADNLGCMRAWKDYQRILLEYGVIVYPRRGSDLEKIRQDLLDENPDYRISLLSGEFVDISSSQIREALKH